MPRALLVTNPHAGGKSPECDPTWLRWRLEGMGWSVPGAATVPPGPADGAFRDRVHAVDIVVASGGDGTIRRLLPYLAFQPQALAIMPCGTGNDLARSLGVPLDPMQALELAHSGLHRRIDLAGVNGHLFVNVAALGVSANVSLAVDETLKERFGTVAYRLAVVREVWRWPTIRLCLTTNGRRHRILAHQISIANGFSFGGGWRVAADAALDDHLLDIVVVGPMALADRWRRWRTREEGGLTEMVVSARYRSQACRIEARGPLTVNLDGDPVSLVPPLRVEVLPCALTVIVPARESALSA